MHKLKIYLQKVKAQLIRFAMLGALTGCLTPIEIEVENADGIVVIGGQVSNFTDQSVVQVGLTADTERLPVPVSGAQVWIVDETNETSVPLAESASFPGTYHPENYQGIPGHAYHVKVEIPKRGTYESKTDVMPPVAGTLTTRYEFKTQQYTDLEGVISEQPFFYVYASAQLPETEALYMRWNVDEVFLLSPTDFPDPFGSIPPPCYVAQSVDPQRVVLYDGSKIHARSFENLLIASRIVDWNFLEKHAFTSYQSSISEAAHAYWAKVDILSNQTGSIFDTPPAAITGNVTGTGSDDRVFGFFFATAQTQDRFFVYRSDVPFPLSVIECTYSGDRAYTSYPPRCLDCTSVRNSSYNRPDWF